MAVPASAIWSIPNDDVVDAAYARLGGERTGGWEAKSAVRNLQLLLQYFESKRVNLWTIKLRSFGTLPGQIAYTLPADTIDVLDLNHQTGTNVAEIPIARTSRTDWFALPNKNSAGTPTLYYVDRARDAPVLRFWPAPDGQPRTIKYAAVTRTRDVGSLADNLDAPRRWLPAVVAGLAYYLGRERAMRINDPIAELIRGELPRLKADFDADFETAMEEDRDSAALTFDTDFNPYYRA